MVDFVDGDCGVDNLRLNDLLVEDRLDFLMDVTSPGLDNLS